MKSICIDQSMYRSSELAQLIQDANVRFIIPDAALMEMCKSNQWEATVRRSLRPLAEIPDRTFAAKGNGPCLKAELEQGRPLNLDDLIWPEATSWLRRLFVEIAEERRGDQFEGMEAEIGNANDKAREEHFDHLGNLSSLRTLIATLRSAYSQDFQRRLRANLVDEEEYIAVVSNAATLVVDNQSMSIEAGSMERFIARRSYVMRWLWLRVETVTAWIKEGGSETVAAERVTNSDIDRHYLITGSYCDELLTKDRDMQRIDRLLRAALALKSSWSAGR